MSRMYNKILCLILTLSMLLCMVACNPAQPPEDEKLPEDPDVSAPEEEDQLPTEIQLSSKFVLVRPDERDENEIKAIQLLGRALGSIYGEKFSIKTDYLDLGSNTEDVDTYEILIGATNRTHSQDTLATLSYNDWSYRVVDQNTIVICGGCSEGTYIAACAFLKDLFGYQEDVTTSEVLTPGAATMLDIGTTFDYRHQYEISSFTLGKHDLSDYSIVISDRNGSKEAAQEIAHYFLDLTGVELPILMLSKYKNGNDSPAIFLGCANIEDEHLDKDPYSTTRYYIFGDDDHIFLDFKSKAVAVTAAKRFIKECMPKADTGDSHTVSFLEKDLTGLHIPEGTNLLDLNSVETTEVAPGVVYEERLYYDPNGKPVRAYMITVEKGAATIATSLPGDKEKIGTYATMLEQVISASENGKKVVAGVNADFFSSTMLGLCVRDGVELHSVDGRPWFGITKDGTPVLGTAYEYESYAGNLWTGVGGSNVIIDNDYAAHISIDHEFGYTRHPRTAVGIKADGSVVLLVVDGRQSSISNGAALADLADILGSLGCIEALNLDGGGSSTFVLADGEGKFKVTNSPSDGSLRDVADGLMVILP